MGPLTFILSPEGRGMVGRMPAAEAAQDEVFCIGQDKRGKRMRFDHGFV